MKPLVALIPAAGEGTRMKSNLAKVLHPICGRPMVKYVLEAARATEPSRTLVIVGYQRGRVRAALAEDGVEFVEQPEQKGTAHAVLQTEPKLRDFDGDVLVLSGDTPLLRGETLKALVKHHRNSKAIATVLTAEMDDPTGYGRIIRNEEGLVGRIVEDRDTTDEERRIKEVNTGTYCFGCHPLFDALRLVRPDNEQGEYYLTDIFGILSKWNLPIATLTAPDPSEAMGVNTEQQLQEAESVMRRRLENPGQEIKSY